MKSDTVKLLKTLLFAGDRKEFESGSKKGTRNKIYKNK